ALRDMELHAFKSGRAAGRQEGVAFQGARAGAHGVVCKTTRARLVSGGGMTFSVYIGFDSREPETYRVAERSLLKHASIPVKVIPLKAEKLAAVGLLRRPHDTRGQRYDILSNAPASTEFAISRFLPLILEQTGWAMFVDADVVFLRDVAEVRRLADPRYAVMCVKHKAQNDPSMKMDGQVNLHYS